MTRRPILPVLAVLVLLTPLAWANGTQVRTSTATTSNTHIEGVWPTACQPGISREHRTAAGGLDILLEDSTSPCAPGAHRFNLTLPPRDGFSPALSADRITPVRLYGSHDGNAPQLLGFGLRGGAGQSATPDSGFWWPQGDKAASGNVLSLELQGNTLGIALLSHDDASGKPVWYFGTSSLSGKTVHARLSRLDDGSSPFFGMTVQPTPHAGWTIDIAFDSATAARVWLSRPDPVQSGRLELASMHFARRSFASGNNQQQWLGTWLIARDIADSVSEAAAAIPSRLQFTSSQTLDRRHSRLINAQGDFALDCTHAAASSAAPQSCTLRDATGNTLAHFDQVGLERLDGEDAQGHPIVLLRKR